MEKYLLVAKILKPVGLKGEMRIYSYTSFKEIRYKKGNTLFIKINDEYQKVTVKSCYEKTPTLLVVSFEEYPDIDSLNPIIDKELYAIKDENVLYEDEYFYDDLIGLTCFDEDHNILGKVQKVEEFPSQITLNILKKNAKGNFFVPFNDFFVTNIDLKNKEITIHVIEGLIE